MRIRNWYRHFAACGGLALLLLAWVLGAGEPESFRFAIVGDRTGEAQADIYEQVWKEIAIEKPAFVISVGDTIEGLNDKTAPAEWREFDQFLEHLRQYPLRAEVCCAFSSPDSPLVEPNSCREIPIFSMGYSHR